METKVGLGYDIHRLVSGRHLILGGVLIPHELGLVGHSDADCLTHAIIDALLGASGEGDIGQLFPDDDARWLDARSLYLLELVMATLRAKGWEITHVDAVVIAEQPKLGPHVSKIKKTLCPVLGLEENSLSIKAKTNEGLGPVGTEQAVACWAVALIRKTSDGSG